MDKEFGGLLTADRHTLDELEAMALEVLGYRITIADGRSRQTLGSFPPDRLSAPRKRRNRPALAHALAHLITPMDKRRHGMDFMAHWLFCLEGLQEGSALDRAKRAHAEGIRINMVLLHRLISERSIG